ncbi:DNA-binding protein [Halobacterium sp. KA-4]|jgi:programmed cell death protein 5|uniref:DNA-binding protein n=1 Tax=Halobacterium sp. KA-4 TaxID=2896367 RepID=UPI001E39A8D2|nr:DNA-binding protein [Halobacterium sp. KA-4]MCD2198774.1 DNA-binding protein [Halobacterium sp. KA-4]
MSGSTDDDRLEELRQQKKEQLKQQKQQQGGGDAGAAQQAQREQAEQQKQALLKQHLTDGARKRLNTIKMSKPEFAEKAEQQILALAQSGRLQDQIDEEQMKDLLRELKPDSQSFNINRR